ncbi:MAG: hypothetical protein ACTSR1_13415, partial [Candidatus Heimdallarchaeota archaeon]
EMPGLVPITEKPLNVLDYFIESMDLTMGAGFEAFTNGTISTDESEGLDIDVENFEFDGTTMSEVAHVTVANDVLNGEEVKIILDDLEYHFQLFADWNFNIQFGDIIGLIAPQYEEMNFNLGTFPNIDFVSSDGPIVSPTAVEHLITINFEATVPNSLLLSVIATIGFSVLLMVNIRRKSKK